MSEPLDEMYLKWLYRFIANPRYKHHTKTHWVLAKLLFTTEFTWTIPNDDNRAEDGKDLRWQFVQELELYWVDEYWFQEGCSMLEMLIALAKRLEFESDRTLKDWFWELIRNTGIPYATDILYAKDSDLADHVRACMSTVIHRTYAPDGRGGLFPQKSTTRDQRDVELWYQLSEYLIAQS
jgi:hypothetical protein